ncbi:unnamed protein product [Peniophora sp. CBMAI 1063]|nr:unnamed protein product [Peniophora sp. CBMAI 1063]
MDVPSEDYSSYFREVHGRKVNVLNARYALPADDEELKRFEVLHRLTRFVLGGANYVGPVKSVLAPERAPAGDKVRVLDLGTGGGLWAIDMADEFPHAEVLGVDLAPLQPQWVPANCTFELCDLDTFCLPYESNSFDVVHARNIIAGISNYPHFVHELTRILRPGGVLLLIEFDLRPIADGNIVTKDSERRTEVYGWATLADEIQRCLVSRGIDVTVPESMGVIAHNTGWYSEVKQQHADIPIGFWPKDSTLLTVGQLAWTNFDLLMIAVKTLLLSSGIPEDVVQRLIKDAQADLYQPLRNISTRLHLVHAIKRAK